VITNQGLERCIIEGQIKNICNIEKNLRPGKPGKLSDQNKGPQSITPNSFHMQSASASTVDVLVFSLSLAKRGHSMLPHLKLRK
jgi:hypothetical protein